MSQSPSLRGSGRFVRRRYPYIRCNNVSIPFIAGQWSLPCHSSVCHSSSILSQSPSLRGSGRFPSPQGGGGQGGTKSQSPSLRGSGRFDKTPDKTNDKTKKSQSPSLRGSGRFFFPARHWVYPSARLNPLHCGAVVASVSHPKRRKKCSHVSIPFIAGQWSLPQGSYHCFEDGR